MWLFLEKVSIEACRSCPSNYTFIHFQYTWWQLYNLGAILIPFHKEDGKAQRNVVTCLKVIYLLRGKSRRKLRLLASRSEIFPPCHGKWRAENKDPAFSSPPFPQHVHTLPNHASVHVCAYLQGGWREPRPIPAGRQPSSFLPCARQCTSFRYPTWLMTSWCLAPLDSRKEQCHVVEDIKFCYMKYVLICNIPY